MAAALAEDAPWGDVSSEAFVPEQARITARVVAREAGVLSGTNALEAAFRLVDPAVSVTLHLADGADLSPGAVVAEVAGPARSVLRAERVALNLVQRLSGIATTTAAHVAAGAPAAGTRGWWTPARPPRVCACSNGRRCGTEAGTTTASASRMP